MGFSEALQGWIDMEERSKTTINPCKLMVWHSRSVSSSDNDGTFLHEA